jgi:hypothetical protein
MTAIGTRSSSSSRLDRIRPSVWPTHIRLDPKPVPDTFDALGILGQVLKDIRALIGWATASDTPRSETPKAAAIRYMRFMVLLLRLGCGALKLP